MYDYQFYNRERVEQLLAAQWECLKKKKTQISLMKEFKRKEDREKAKELRRKDREASSSASSENGSRSSSRIAESMAIDEQKGKEFESERIAAEIESGIYEFPADQQVCNKFTLFV